MDVNVAGQVNSVIDHLAAKLAVPTEKIVGAVAATGVETVARTSLLLLVVLFVILPLCCWFFKNDYECSLWTTEIIGAVLVLLLVMWFIPSCVLWIANPEAWAVGKILGMFCQAN